MPHVLLFSHEKAFCCLSIVLVVRLLVGQARFGCGTITDFNSSLECVPQAMSD